MENSRRGTSKFTCYFCNKTFENETQTQMGHTAMCSRVLVPCPNKCGSYVPREDLKKHNKDCVNRVAKSSPKVSVSNDFNMGDTRRNVSNIDTRSNLSNTLGRNGVTKPNNQDEIYKLSKKLAELESRFQFSRSQNQSFVTLQNFETLKTAQLQLNLDIEKIKYQNQIVFDWRSKIDNIFSQLRQNISMIEKSRRDMDINLSGLQTRIMLMEKLQEQINMLKESFLREQGYNRQMDMNFNENIDDYKQQFAQENLKNVAILSDLKDSVSSLKLDIENINSNIKDQNIKFTSFIYDLQSINQIATNNSNKNQQLEKNFDDVNKNVNQMKLDLEILEGLSTCSDIKITPGRLIWKITEVDTKMVQAKQTGSVLKSPIFLTHEYGYRVRILLYLNGLKKWKDRYALLCLHVLKGEYDMILKWPCYIEGTLTVKDLEDLEKAKPLTKVITAKRLNGDEECEDPQESSSCYIFIPHTTLMKSNHVKEDTMFLDIKIRQNEKLETSELRNLISLTQQKGGCLVVSWKAVDIFWDSHIRDSTKSRLKFKSASPEESWSSVNNV